MDTKSDFIPGEKYCFSTNDGQYYIGTFVEMNNVGMAILEVNKSLWYVHPGNILQAPIKEEDMKV